MGKTLEKIKGDGRTVLLPPNSMCPTRNVGGEVGEHAHSQVQAFQANL